MRQAQAAEASWYLWKFVYRKRCGLGRLPAFFRTVPAMARRVPVVHVTRPVHPFRLDALGGSDRGTLAEREPAGRPPGAGGSTARGHGNRSMISYPK